VARTESVREERAQNEARQRAQVERRMVAGGRLRAAEEALRATEPPVPPRGPETRIPARTAEGGGSAAIAPVERDADEASSIVPASDRAGTGSIAEPPVAESEGVPVPVAGADEPSVVAEASPAEGTAASEGPEEARRPKQAFEERVDIDSSARSTSGWSDTWTLLRGQRKD
jgi:hypothetical protein